MQERSCIIIGAAEQGPDRTLLAEYADLDGQNRALVICADGGFRHAETLGLKPDCLIGDFDSLKEEGWQIPKDCSGKSGQLNIKRLKTEKDETDLFACVLEGLRGGFNDFILIYCTGGRLDHFMGAVAVLEYIFKQGAKGIILDTQNEMTILKDGTLILDKKTRFPYLSILPLDSKLVGVSITGVKYPLCDAVLYREIGLGISNEIMESQATIRIDSGTALIIRSRDQ